jgi:hypothetical protein
LIDKCNNIVFHVDQPHACSGVGKPGRGETGGKPVSLVENLGKTGQPELNDFSEIPG